MNRTRSCAAGQAPPADALLAAALDYAARGWRVLPVHSIAEKNCTCHKKQKCASAGKHPRTRHGLKDATIDFEIIRGWWSKWPTANVGIATGAESGVVVIDVDPRHGGNESLAALQEQLGPLPAGPVVATGGGGWHLFFAHAEGLHNRTGAAEGIDFKTDRGYVVAPPSVHLSGERYAWHVQPDGAPLPPLPATWRLFFLGHDATESAQTTESADDDGKKRKSTDAMHAQRVCCKKSEGDIAAAIEAAIRATLPSGPGRRYRQVFELARALKAIPHLADADPDALRPYVERWHARALPCINTEPFEETWIDFLKGWPNVRFPKGEGPMRTIMAELESRPLPPAADRYPDHAGLRRLVGLCAALQRTAGEGPFFLACRTASALLGVDAATASRWLFLLGHDGIVEVVEPGDRTRRRATRFRYIATT